MVSGWRRAFCTSIPKDNNINPHSDDSHTSTRTPKITSKFGFFSSSSSSSNPSTPRLQSQSQPQTLSTPTLRCRTTTANSSLPSSPKLHSLVLNSSSSSSPKSPSTFSLLKLRVLSKARCGICLQSVKAGQGTAIFTAECSHSFHFPCITSHLNTNSHRPLLCPLCNSTWSELPLLSLQQQQQTQTVSRLKDSKSPSAATGKNLRVYDDDEPLMSPTSGARFNPIPENEEEGDGDNNFHGFYVVEDTGRAVDVRLLPEAAVVAVGRRYETRALLMKVKAPPPPPAARRAPIDVVAVVDVGAAGTRIQMAKRAMRMVASSLGTNDRLSIVAFSAASKRLLPLRRMTNAGKRSARRIADALGSVVAAGGHGMSVSDAVKKAAKVLEDRRERNPAATILLLSDKTQTIVSSAHVAVHALGLGEAWTDDALAKRVACFLSVVAQDLRLQVSPAAPAEIAAVYSLTHRPAALGCGGVRVGDLHAEEEREFLVELRVPTCAAGSHHVLSVRSSHRDPTTEMACSRDQTMLVPRAQSVRSAPPSSERLRSLHVATRAVAESRRLAEHGDLPGAHHMLSSARALLLLSKSASAEEFARGLEAELGELHRLMSQRQRPPPTRSNPSTRADEKPEPLTPTSAWRAAERLAKVAIMRKSMNRVSDLHGFENARF